MKDCCLGRLRLKGSIQSYGLGFRVFKGARWIRGLLLMIEILRILQYLEGYLPSYGKCRIYTINRSNPS